MTDASDALRVLSVIPPMTQLNTPYPSTAYLTGFLRSRGVLVFDRAEGGWPRVKVACDYKRPFQSGDAFEVLLGISRIGASSVAWNFEVLNTAGEIAAFGSMTNVRVDREGRPKLISDEERAALI